MKVAERLRTLREQKHLSQGEIEKRTGLLRCYLSRVENGHTVPAIETLEKITRALGVPMYQFFYDNEEPMTALPKSARSAEPLDWASNRKGQRLLGKLRWSLARMNQEDRKLVMFIVQKMSERNGRVATQS